MIFYCSCFTVRKEIKWRRNSEILLGLVYDTTWISSYFTDFRVVSWTNSCSISEFPLHFISFLTVTCTYMILVLNICLAPVLLVPRIGPDCLDSTSDLLGNFRFRAKTWSLTTHPGPGGVLRLHHVRVNRSSGFIRKLGVLEV